MTPLPKREPLTALQRENKEAAERESAAIKQDIQRRMENILARLRKEKRNDEQAKEKRWEGERGGEAGRSQAGGDGGDDRVVL